MELQDLIGKHTLSGVDTSTMVDESSYNKDVCDVIRFILDGVTYVAMENPCDGWRSYMDELRTTEVKISNTFPPQEVIGIKADEEGSYGYKDDIIQFFDVVTGVCVLELGTANTDDYYPFCVMVWNPKGLAINIGVTDTSPSPPPSEG